MKRTSSAIPSALAALTLLAAAHGAPLPPAAGVHPPASRAPSPGPDSGASFNIGVWTVRTSSVDSNFKTGDFSAPNKVVMTREGGDVTADRASGNFNTSQATLYGHVVMHDREGNFAGLSSGAHAQSRGPSTLTADQAHLDGKAKVYEASGNVHYVQADTTVVADRAVLHDDTHDLFLDGSVHITQGARNMRGDHVRYNTDSGDSHAQGDVTLQFPSTFNPAIATPRPINIRNPLSKKSPAPTPAPSATP